MEKISDRILLIIQQENLSIRKFELKIGCANGTIQTVVKNGTNIGSKWVTKIIEKFPQYNPDWIMTGSGNVLRTITLVNDPEIKYSNNTKPSNVPLVNLSAIAGFGSSSFSISEREIHSYYVLPDFGKVDFMIHVFGNSMYPKYNSGDIIACRKIDQDKFIQWNKCHVIATREQGILVKRIMMSERKDCIMAISDNKDYPPFNIPQNEITGIALVVGVVRLE
jgi:repressor LexA